MGATAPQHCELFVNYFAVCLTGRSSQHGKDPLHAKAPSGDAGRGLGNFGKIKTLPEYRQRIYQPRNQTVRSKGTRKAEIKLLSRPCWNGGIWYKRTHGREFH